MHRLNTLAKGLIISSGAVFLHWSDMWLIPFSASALRLVRLGYGFKTHSLTSRHWRLLRVGTCFAVLAPGYWAADLRAETVADEFKAFIATPPTISELKWHRQFFGIKDVLPPASNLYEARWQSNAFFLREVRSEADYTEIKAYRGLSCFGKFGKRFWFFPVSGGLQDWQDDGTFPKSFTSNETYSAVRHDLDHLSEVLNFGVQNVYPGTIAWSGDQFECVSDVTAASISGKLAVDGSGHPASMTLTYTAAGKEFHYLVRYMYESRLGLDCLPNQFAVNYVENGKESPRFAITIDSLNITNTLLSEDLFSPEPYRDTNVWSPAFHQTNANKYFIAANGNPAVVLPRQPTETSHRVAFYFVAAVVVALPPLLWLLTRRQKHN